MAGYIFAVAKDSWNDFCAESLKRGSFTPFVPIIDLSGTDRQIKSTYKILLATYADLVTMKAGDNIYFLSDRKLYGIGKAVNIDLDCKYDNYINASALPSDDQVETDSALTTQATNARWVCYFVPAPQFFKLGVDMDDVLRYKPNAFKMLRAFEGLSFIKIDDEENRALKEYIFLENEKVGRSEEAHFAFDDSLHTSLHDRDLSPYILNLRKALEAHDIDELRSEMLVEAFFLQKVARGQIPFMGRWDHLTHQLIASPFKPLKYIDKIDVFGYRFSEHYLDDPKLITKFLIIELKKDKVNKSTLEQLMQYVDWICDEYASGDYSLIEAYVLGSGIVRNTAQAKQDVCQRSYIASTHPVVQKKWTNVKFIQYQIEEDDISFSLNDLDEE